MSSMIILMADDDDDDRLIAKEAFEETPVPPLLYFVKNGEEILDYLYQRGNYKEAKRPHLILLDLNMPRKDGWEVLTEIKNDPYLKQIPVIVFTTSRQSADVSR